MKLKLYTDGGARGNPGPAACGYVVFDHAGKVLEKCGNYLGHTTNHQAEYQGLIDGLTYLVKSHPGSAVDIYMDSNLVVNQVLGKFKMKNAALAPKLQEVKELLSSLASFTISYVPRAKNALADQVVNDTLDAQL